MALIRPPAWAVRVNRLKCIPGDGEVCNAVLSRCRTNDLKPGNQPVLGFEHVAHVLEATFLEHALRGHAVRMKIVSLPDGARRVKPEYDDVARLAEVTGITLREAMTAAREVAERVAADRVLNGAGAS